MSLKLELELELVLGLSLGLSSNQNSSSAHYFILNRARDTLFFRKDRVIELC